MSEVKCVIITRANITNVFSNKFRPKKQSMTSLIFILTGQGHESFFHMVKSIFKLLVKIDILNQCFEYIFKGKTQKNFFYSKLELLIFFTTSHYFKDNLRVHKSKKLFCEMLNCNWVAVKRRISEVRCMSVIILRKYRCLPVGFETVEERRVLYVIRPRNPRLATPSHFKWVFWPSFYKFTCFLCPLLS